MATSFKHYGMRLLCAFGLLHSVNAYCLGSLWTDWLGAVSSQLGYSVVQGSAHVFELSDCAVAIQIFHSCGGNNPAAPYIEIQPPVSNGSVNEFVDPCYVTSGRCDKHSKGDVANSYTVTSASGNDVNQYYRLGRNDAIVVVVSMPPRAAYLGYQSYVYSRADSHYSFGRTPCDSIVYADRCRPLVLGSIGNSINNITLKSRSATLTFSTPNAQTAPAEVVFISTPNKTLYNQLRHTFLSAGGSSSQIFVEPFYSTNEYSWTAPAIDGFPHSTRNVIPQFDSSSETVSRATGDEFNTLMRYAVFEDQTASRRWLCAINQDSGSLSSACQNLAPLPPSPIAVYRITKPSEKGQIDRFYGRSILATRGSNSNETHIHGVNYKTVASDLAGAIGIYMQQKLSMVSAMKINEGRPAGNVGPHCIAYKVPCYEDTQDTAPYNTSIVGTLNDKNGNIAFLVGVNHASPAVNNATYVSVGVYDGGSLQPQSFDFGLLEGVASLSQTNPDAAGFDSCTNASTDPTKSNCLNGSALQVWKDIGQPSGARGSLNSTTVANLYVATVARDTYCAAGGAGLPFCSSAYVTAGYTITPITPPSGVTNKSCDAINDPDCGKYLPLEDIVGLSERVYIVPGLSNGADPNKIVYPYLVH